MAGAINYNNIIDIIKSKISQGMSAINSAAVSSKVDMSTDDLKKKIRGVNDVVDLIFSKTGFFGKIVDYVSEVSISKLLKIPIVLQYAAYALSKIIRTVKKYNDIEKLDFSSIQSLTDLISSMRELLDVKNNMKSAAGFKSLGFLLKMYFAVLDEIIHYNMNDDIFRKIDDLNLAATGIIDILKLFKKDLSREMSSLFLTMVYLNTLIPMYFSILNIIWGMRFPDDHLVIMDELIKVTSKLKNLCKELGKLDSVLSLGALVRLKILLSSNMLYNVLLSVSKVLNKISELQFNNVKNIGSQLKNVALAVSCIQMIVADMLILVPMLSALILVAPVLIIGTLVLKSILYIMLKVLTLSVDDTMVNKVAVISAVLAILIIIGIELVLLAGVSMLLIYAWKPISVYFLVLFGVMIGLAGVAVLSRFLVSNSMIWGLLLINIAVASLTITAWFLILLGVASIAVLAVSKHILLFMLFIVALTAIIAIMGIGLIHAIPFMEATMLAMIPLAAAITAITVMALMLWLLGKIKFTEDDKEHIKENVACIMDTAIDIMFAIFNAGYQLGDGNNKTYGSDGWFMRVFKGTIGSAALVVAAFAAAGILVPLTIALIAVIIIGGLLKLLGDKGFNFTKDDKILISDRIKLIIETAMTVITAIFEPNSNDTKNTPDDRGWFADVLKTIEGAMSIIAVIMAVGFLAITIVAIGMLMILSKMLRFLASDTFAVDRNAVTQRVQDIIGAATSVIDAIFGNKKEVQDTPSNKNWLKKAISWVGEKASSVFSGIKNITGMLLSIGFLAMTMISIGMVYIVAKQLTYISKLSFSKDDIINKTKLIISSANSVISLLTESKLSKAYTKQIEGVNENTLNINNVLSSISKMSKTMSGMYNVSDKMVDNNAKIVGNYIKFLDKVNTVKLENVKTLTNLFAKMADFSKSIHGDIDGLVEALVNRISPLLEELRDIMKGLPKEVQSGTENISKTIINTAGGAASWTPSNINKASSSVSNKDEQEAIKKEQFIKSQRAKEIQDAVYSILAEIKDVMTGQGAYPSGVKTY